MKKILIATLIFLYGASMAYAGSSTRTLVIHPLSAQGVFFFYTQTNITGSPFCASQKNRWAINPNSASGRVTIASVLTAYTLGKTVAVQGQNKCDIWANTESIQSLYFY